MPVFHDTDKLHEEFLQQRSTAHRTGFTEYSPTLSHHGAYTEEMIKEYAHPNAHRSNSSKEYLVPITLEKDAVEEVKKDAPVVKIPPYISGYAGYIPGANRTYGVSFRKSVEEGDVEWHEAQDKLQVRTDDIEAYADKIDPDHHLSSVMRDIENDYGHDHGYREKRHYFEDDHVTEEDSATDSSIGHTPSTSGQAALSKVDAATARNDLELLQMDPETRFDLAKNADSCHRVLDQAYLDATRHMRR